MTPTFYDVLTEEPRRAAAERGRRDRAGEGRTHVEERVVETRSLSRPSMKGNGQIDVKSLATGQGRTAPGTAPGTARQGNR